MIFRKTDGIALSALIILFLLLEVFSGFKFLFPTKPAAAVGTNYYVDSSVADANPASGTPDCTNYNTTTFACSGGASSVYVTIADINAATFSPGDTISFRRGQTWSGSIVVPSAGTAGNQITFNSFGTGEGPIINCAGNNYCVNITGKNYVTVTGLTLTGATIDGISLNPSLDYNNSSLVTNAGSVIEDFESTSGWTLLGGGATLTADTNEKTQGTQSIKLSGTQGQIIYMTKTVNLDLSADGSFVIDLYSDTYNSARAFRLYFSSTNDFSKQFFADVNLGTRLLPNAHWNRIVVSKSDFTNTGGESWNNTMISMRLGTYIGGGGAPPFIWFDNLKFGYDTKAVALISFDDGYRNVLTSGKPIFDANNQAATVFANQETIVIGPPNWLDEADLTALYNAGWDISNHTLTHPNLTSLDAATLEQEVNDMYDYLYTTLGFTRSAKFFAYPEGLYNDTVVTKILENHKLARTTDDGRVDPHPDGTDDDYMYMGAYGLTLGVAAIQTAIDNIILRNGVLSLYGHDVGAGGVSVADLTSISNYLKSREADIATLTYSQYYAGKGLTGIKINYNVIKSSGRYGIGVNSAGDYEIYNNVITGNTTAGIGVSETKASDAFSIKNNIFYNNGSGADAYALYSDTTGLPVSYNLDYNLYHEPDAHTNLFFWEGVDFTSLANLVTGISKETNGIESDPTFVSGTDFRLQSGSPAVDQGTDVGLSADSTGMTIPQGSAEDMGAYERDETAPSSVGAPTFGTITTSSIEIIKPASVTETGSGLFEWQARRDGATTLGWNGVATSSDSDSSLSANTQYSYDVAFTDVAGNTSSYGTTAAKYTLAPTPTNFSGVAGETNINLSVDSFTNSSAGSSGYLFSNLTDATDSGWIQTNGWNDTGLSCGTSYSYSVIYRNGDGTSTASASSSISTTSCPSGGGGGGGSSKKKVQTPVVVPPVSLPVYPTALPCPPGALFNVVDGTLCPVQTAVNPAPVVRDFGPNTLRKGSVGEEVKNLQRFLNEVLWLQLTVDGKFGRQTAIFVRYWQRINGLPGDGVVGPKTKAKMNAAPVP